MSKLRTGRFIRAALYVLLGITFAGCGSQGVSTNRPAKAAEPAPKKDLDDIAKKRANRLAKETSPYLLLHAHNPVDWFPWGPEALAKAKKENKPIFLSVGYSSCHWCHVMERESFTDKEIADFLNKHFVCIKVDREERPDIDSIYMKALQVFNRLTGSGRGGGWPMSMFLTPEAKPFFGGTYFPARNGDRGQATGFLTIVTRVHEAWGKDAATIRKDADLITRFTKQELENKAGAAAKPLDEKIAERTLAAMEKQYDEKYGGFGGFSEANPRQPKFPEPSNLIFLLDHIRRTKDKRSQEMLVSTLQRMAMGGIRDHWGGGFHRYSVDRYWQIPHFEKMLYDNGQLASVYSEAYLLTGREEFRRLVDEMMEFVLREMTDPAGGFYSALDAESEDEEGKFYRWDKSELQKLLTKEEFALLASVYGLNGPPNFEEKYYAPQLSKPLSEIAAEQNTTPAKLEARLTPIRRKLLAARGKRPRPLTDTKILTSWNGLMIRGLADAGRILKNDHYLEAAEGAADFVLTKLRDKDGRLLRSYGQGRAKLNAYLNDYSFFVDGLIALHRATGKQKWLTAADELTQKQLELFWDEKSGGCFFTSNDHESLIARSKNPIDGAQPAGNSVSAHNLVYLAVALKKPEYLGKAEQTIQSISELLEKYPNAATRMVVAASALVEAKAEKK